jgi:hypothetical protein
MITIQELANRVRELEERMEYKLSVLDSANIIEIDMSKTKIKDGNGSEVGSLIKIKGKNGELFTVGNNNGRFEFMLKGKNGQSLMYLDESGKLVISE